MLKLILIICLPIFIASCSPTKQEVLDKCITQANETFSKDAGLEKTVFVGACVKSHGYTLTSACRSDAPVAKFAANCYE